MPPKKKKVTKKKTKKKPVKRINNANNTQKVTVNVNSHNKNEETPTTDMLFNAVKSSYGSLQPAQQPIDLTTPMLAMATMLQSSLGNNQKLDNVQQTTPVVDPFRAYDDIESVSMMDYAPFTTENVNKIPNASKPIPTSSVSEATSNTLPASVPSNWNAFNQNYEEQLQKEYDFLTDDIKGEIEKAKNTNTFKNLVDDMTDISKISKKKTSSVSSFGDDINSLASGNTKSNFSMSTLSDQGYYNEYLLGSPEQKYYGQSLSRISNPLPSSNMSNVSSLTAPSDTGDLRPEYYSDMQSYFKRNPKETNSVVSMPSDFFDEISSKQSLAPLSEVSNGPAVEIPEVQQKPKKLSEEQINKLMTPSRFHNKIHIYNGKEYNKDEIQKVLFGKPIDSNKFGTVLNQNQDKLGFELKRSNNKVLITHGLWDHLAQKALDGGF